ncbi:MAG: aldo/keto reductase [Clostridia bacterium]
MRKILLGRTNIEATCQSFGALPIQRTEQSEVIKILQRAYDGGINFYDTARVYGDSEEKIGLAFTPSMRQNIFIATKSNKKTKDEMLSEIQTSLKLLKTDYVDIFQAHNIKTLPDTEDENGIYAALIEAQKRGYCRYIGVTSHRIDVAEQSLDSGLYDTLQFPISYLSAQRDLDLITKAQEKNIGMIGMKGLAGGALTCGKAVAAFAETQKWLVPIWGISKMSELEEFLSFADNPPQMTDEITKIITHDRATLTGNFCRACGYCMPCTAFPKMEMNVVMRMHLNLGRPAPNPFLSEYWQEQMLAVEKCIDCGACKARCPYELDCPTVMRENLEKYRKLCADNGIVI